MVVTPRASCTLVPTRFSSTSLPMGIRPSGVLTSAPYGWQALHCCGVAGGPAVEHPGGVDGGGWRRGDPAVHPPPRVERRLLVDQEVGQLVGEDLCVHLGGEVLVLLAPAADRV